MLELLDQASREVQDRSSIALEWPGELLHDSAVLDWFAEIYKPTVRRNQNNSQGDPTLSMQKKVNVELCQKYWKELDLSSLELYRVGTTSFILRCQIKILVGEHLVLKCLLFPYTRVTPITDATRDYALKYAPGKVPATTRIRSSTEKWILMDFVQGPTLQEFLQAQRNSERKAPPFLRTDVLSSVGKYLLDALCALSCAGFQHEDLTPSNIIVNLKADGSVEKVILIDLGRNYFYTRKIGLAVNREALFVAPEVKEDKSTDTSDVYSFGMILVELAFPQGLKEELSQTTYTSMQLLWHVLSRISLMKIQRSAFFSSTHQRTRTLIPISVMPLLTN